MSSIFSKFIPDFLPTTSIEIFGEVLPKLSANSLQGHAQNFLEVYTGFLQSRIPYQQLPPKSLAKLFQSSLKILFKIMSRSFSKVIPDSLPTTPAVIFGEVLLKFSTSFCKVIGGISSKSYRIPCQ